MVEQQKSKTFRYGNENQYHLKASGRLTTMLQNDHWEVHPEVHFITTWSLVDRPDPSDTVLWQREEYRHNFDMYATKKILLTGLKRKLIVEIDGKAHESKAQQLQDQRAQDFAIFFIKDVQFVRMDISVLLNPCISDRAILEMYKIVRPKKELVKHP